MLNLVINAEDRLSRDHLDWVLTEEQVDLKLILTIYFWPLDAALDVSSPHKAGSQVDRPWAPPLSWLMPRDGH